MSEITYKFTKEEQVNTPYEKVLKKYNFDVPEFMTKDFQRPVYKITCTFTQGDKGFAYMRKRLYYINQKFLIIDPKFDYISQSYRKIPDGICQIKQQPLIIDNFITLQIPQDWKENEIINIQADNEDNEKNKDKLHSKAIIYQGQYIGELFPNEHLICKFKIESFVHKGCHAYWLIIRDKEEQLHFYSNYTIKELESMIKETPMEESDEEQIQIEGQNNNSLKLQNADYLDQYLK